MSVHDSQRIGEALRADGYEAAPHPSEADVLVLTTCSVREKARQKVRSAIGRWKHFAESARRPTVVVAGCVAQQDGKQLLDEIDHVDVVVGPDHIWRVPELVERARCDGKRSCFVGFAEEDSQRFLGLGVEGAPRVSSYVTIQKGCDQRCAYCIVPFVRGPGRCRPAEDIRTEVGLLVKRGAREIVLLGQTVNSYLWDDTDFPRLLELVCQIEGVERVRYESAHPRFLSESLIQAHVDLPNLCEHVHLPVQSGADDVLARMGRGHKAGEFIEWVGALRRACPEVGISSDLFVGFPGEREADFEQTLSFLREVRFDAAFSFKYSPRPGTAAAELEDDVPPEVKVDRLRRLQDLQSKITAEHLGSLVGEIVEVLVEGESRTGGQLRGRSRRNTVVNVDYDERSLGSSDSFIGELLSVEIVEAGGHSLRGAILGEGRRASEKGGIPA